MSTTIRKSIKSTKKTSLKPKKPINFYLRVFSRHPSTRGLRKKVLIPGGRKVVYRHGSTTPSVIPREINSVSSVKNSADKLLMKQCFDSAKVSHAPWMKMSEHGSSAFKKFMSDVKFDKEVPALIVKHRFGSRGKGNFVIKSKSELESFIKSHASNLSTYIVEVYKNYSVEYRLHISEGGCFYACRKMLKEGTPEDKKFQRHDDNCVWYMESNPGFNKPANWNEIVEDCKRALRAIGADVLAFDVKCTSIKDKKDKKCSWILLESCSAPSFGDVTLEKYCEEIPKIVKRKYSL